MSKQKAGSRQQASSVKQAAKNRKLDRLKWLKYMARAQHPSVFRTVASIDIMAPMKKAPTPKKTGKAAKIARQRRSRQKKDVDKKPASFPESPQKKVVDKKPAASPESPSGEAAAPQAKEIAKLQRRVVQRFKYHVNAETQFSGDCKAALEEYAETTDPQDKMNLLKRLADCRSTGLAWIHFVAVQRTIVALKGSQSVIASNNEGLETLTVQCDRLSSLKADDQALCDSLNALNSDIYKALSDSKTFIAKLRAGLVDALLLKKEACAERHAKHTVLFNKEATAFKEYQSNKLAELQDRWNQIVNA